MVRPTLTNMYPVEIRYYPLMISLNKCAGSSNVLFPEICFPKATKDINVKAFNMTTNKNEAKAMTEHISCVEHLNVNVEIIVSTRKVIVGILAYVFVRIVSI